MTRDRDEESPKARLSTHLQTRLMLRNIPPDLPQRIFLEAEERFTDKQTGHKIATKEVRLHGRQRQVMIAYEEESGTAAIITLHPLKDGQKENRIAAGRWTRL